MASRSLFVELGVNDRKLGSGLRKSEKSFKRFGKRAAAGLKRAFSSVSAIGGSGVAFGFAAAAGGVKEFEQTLEDLRVQAERTVAGVGATRGQIDRLANIGADRNQLVGGVAELVDIMGADSLSGQNIKTMGRAMVASRAEARDLARVMLGLRESFELNPDQYEEALGIMLSIGKQGSVPLAEMATIFSGSAASFVQAGGAKGLEGLKQMTAALQVAKPAFGGAAEGATGLEAVMGTLQSRHKEIKKVLGVDVFDKVRGADGKKNFVARSPFAVLEDMANSEKLQRDPRLIMKALGRRKEARKMLQTFMEKRDDLAGLEDKANGDQIGRDVVDRQNSPIGKLNKSYAKLKVTLAEAFTPERIEKFAEGIEKIGELMSALVDNLKTVVALYAAAKLAGPAMSLIGPAAGLLGKTGAGAAMNAAGAGALGTTGLLGAAGLVTAAGALGYAFGSLMDDMFDFSGGLSDMAVDLFGPWEKVAEAGPSQKIEAVNERFQGGETDSATYTKERNGAFEAQAYRAADATANLVGRDLMEQKGLSLDKLRNNVSGLDEKGLAEYRELARKIAIGVDQGKDTSDLANKLASIIAGQKITVELNGNAVTSMLQNNGFSRIQQ